MRIFAYANVRFVLNVLFVLFVLFCLNVLFVCFVCFVLFMLFMLFVLFSKCPICLFFEKETIWTRKFSRFPSRSGLAFYWAQIKSLLEVEPSHYSTGADSRRQYQVSPVNSRVISSL